MGATTRPRYVCALFEANDGLNAVGYHWDAAMRCWCDLTEN